MAKVKQCLICEQTKEHWAKGLCKPCYEHKRYTDWYGNTRTTRPNGFWCERNLKRKFNLSLAEYNRMLLAQKGLCAICGKPPRTYRLGVDHNHQTGKIRDLLCTTCNGLLSHVEGVSNFSVMARTYLVKHNAENS